MPGGVLRCRVTICDQIHKHTLQCKQNWLFCKNRRTTFQPLPRVQIFFDIIIQYIVTNGFCPTIMSRCVLDPILSVNQSKSINTPPVIVTFCLVVPIIPGWLKCSAFNDHSWGRGAPNISRPLIHTSTDLPDTLTFKVRGDCVPKPNSWNWSLPERGWLVEKTFVMVLDLLKDHYQSAHILFILEWKCESSITNMPSAHCFNVMGNLYMLQLAGVQW